MPIPEPDPSERPTEYADRVGEWYTSTKPTAYRKQHGQYFTPVQVADFMARQCRVQKETVRILDPGAGTGILTCAVCEYLATRDTKPREIIIEAYESDSDLFFILRKVMIYLREYLKSKDISIIPILSTEDFVLKYGEALEATSSLFSFQTKPNFDLTVSNPPYFKIPKSDPRSKAATAVVHGQPNIYALFMAIAASLLVPDGELIFITPRSFASGLYFRRFRKCFFSRMKPEAIHIFASRRDSFRRDRVLQENIVLKARRVDNWTSRKKDERVFISSSQGADDLVRDSGRSVSIDVVLDLSSPNALLHIPSSNEEETIIRFVQSWPGSLNTYGLEISTGPVVPFRAVPLLAERGDILKTHAPLLWMQSVRMMKIQWPVNVRGKPQYITRTEKAMPLLLPNKNYVLIRRMSAKEDSRRVTAAPLLAESLGASSIGLENHLNYIHRPGGALSENEAWGLAALYNSSLFDTYFRSLNGNTQVSATELRAIPLPSLEAIVELGQKARTLANPERDIEQLISSMFEPIH